MMKRPDYIKCIRKDKNFNKSLCGRGTVYDWMFVDIQHANDEVESGGRLTPCKFCVEKTVQV